MTQIATTVEQSKKLIELGIDVNTADMMWTYDFTIGRINGLNVISTQLKPEENDIPAWSLSALLDILPFPQLSKDKLGGGKVRWMASVYPDNRSRKIYWTCRNDGRPNTKSCGLRG